MDKKKLKRVDFVWVNRDYQSFEWFIELLGQIELQQINSNKDKRFIGIHLYMTSAKKTQQIKPLDSPDFDTNGQIENKIDEFTLQLNPGRPDFDQVVISFVLNKKRIHFNNIFVFF